MARLSFIHFLLVSAVTLFFSLITHSQPLMSKALPCLEFKNRLCIRCPDLTHLNKQQCYQNINDCAEYQYGSASAICRKQLIQQNSTLTTASTVTVTNTSYFHTQSTTSQSSATVSFNSIFNQVSIVQARKDPLFIRCNDHMRRGQYSHFISRSQNPIKSVFQSIYQDFKDFKILYEGSGGNLLMCLIGININTQKIVLKSFVTIGRTQIIQDCVDYTSGMQCNRCRDGYHLDSSVNGDTVCVVDIPGCVEYLGNICAKCRGHYFLIENRCVAGCEMLRDSRSLMFYGDYGMSITGTVSLEVSRCYFW